MPKYQFTATFFPFSDILLGFHYQAGEYRTSESEDQRGFEEYSIGLIFIHLSVSRYM